MPRPTKEDNEKRLAFLQRVRDDKTTLFGKFSSDLENTKKVQAWNELLQYAKSLAIVSDSRDYTFLRDKIFGSWKSRTLKKKDNSRRTGTGGGKNNVMNEIDNMILDIIGKDSPVIDGLPIPESYLENVEHQIEYEEEDQIVTIVSPSPKTIVIPSPTQSEFPITIRKRKLSTGSEAKEQAMMEKWKAQTELLKQQKYNIMLQNVKLEKELNIPQSEYTAACKQY